jgi:coenzyme F420 hydrogenase subunit beta
MIFNRIDTIRAWRLCLGCGACVSACPEKNIELRDVVNRGLRPVLKSKQCQSCQTCVSVCPGVGLPEQSPNAAQDEWGGISEIWEGYACHAETRFRASSGGAATALASFCLTEKKVEGVLHTGVDSNNPIRNVPVFSQAVKGLLDCSGSRYSPAGPCVMFERIRQAKRPCVFVGKPCDVAALKKYQAVYPDMQEKVLLAISIFCAGTPSTNGTLKTLQTMGIPIEQLAIFRYRGHGWPGMTYGQTRDGQIGELTYDESWGDILSKHVQFRCRLCPDSTGEYADISCGDPWYRPRTDDPGESLVIARTEKGISIVREAIDKGYLNLEKVAPEVIALSQKSLLHKRRNLWARLGMLKLFNIPVPNYRGFNLIASWKRLSCRDKVKSFGSTLKRILQRKWYQPDPEEIDNLE